MKDIIVLSSSSFKPVWVQILEFLCMARFVPATVVS